MRTLLCLTNGIQGLPQLDVTPREDGCNPISRHRRRESHGSRQMPAKHTRGKLLLTMRGALTLGIVHLASAWGLCTMNVPSWLTSSTCVLLAASAAAAAEPAGKVRPTADLVLTGGKVWTANKAQPEAA